MTIGEFTMTQNYLEQLGINNNFDAEEFEERQYCCRRCREMDEDEYDDVEEYEVELVEGEDSDGESDEESDGESDEESDEESDGEPDEDYVDDEVASPLDDDYDDEDDYYDEDDDCGSQPDLDRTDRVNYRGELYDVPRHVEDMEGFVANVKSDILSLSNV